MSTAHAGLLVPGDHKHRCPKCHESKFCPHACSPCEDQSEGQAVPHGYYAECEDCARPRTMVRSIPYAGVSNPMPRTTTADRERIKQWEQEARTDLAKAEPTSTRLERAYLQAATSRKSWLVLYHPGEGDTPITRDDWRNHWRSLPDYDGPSMRAPSGGRWTRDYETGLLNAQMSLCFGLVWWHKHIRGLESGVRADNGRKDERGAVRFANWYMEDFHATRMITDCFDPPSKGGRGWCPKLAGVDR